MTWSVNRRAALGAVWETRVTDDIPAGDARTLLEMLGVVAEAGHELVSDDVIQHQPISPINDADPMRAGAARVEAPRPKNCTTPVGLLNLAPIPVATPKPKPKSKPKSKAIRAKKAAPAKPTGCGTPGGRSRHQRAGEPVCQVCKDASAKWHRERRAQLRAEREAGKVSTLPPRPETCGSLAGRSNHVRRGETLCPACATFYAAYCRTRDQRKPSDSGEERSA